MTDNGSANRSHAHASACRQLGIRRLFTQPYRPKTNGKAEALHPDPAQRMGLCRGHPTSHARTQALPGFIDRYNNKRPHKALNGSPHAQRLTERLNAAATCWV